MKQTTASARYRTHTRRSSLLTATVLLCLLMPATWIGSATSQSGSLPPSGPALTERFEVGQSFTLAYPAGWTVRQLGNVQQMFAAPPEAIDRGQVLLDDIASIVVHTEQRKDHAEALLRLKQFEAESNTPSQFVEIAGWPALQRQQLIERPTPGDPASASVEPVMQLVVTTAIAADDLIIRLEGALPAKADSASVAAVVAIGEGVITGASGDPAAVQEEVERLIKEPIPRSPGPDPSDPGSTISLDSAPPAPELARLAGAPLRVTSQPGIDAELEITVSTDGRDIVIGSNSNYFYSNDGGQSFSTSAGISGNDPSLGYGPSGTFYAANIGGVCNTAILTSTNNGQTFTPTTSAYTCPNAIPMPGMGGCVQDAQCGGGFPDQEHIAVDRFNPAPGGDQLYSTWRSLWSTVGIGIVCSQDGGATWGPSPPLFTLGDFPRITVGQDGRVYVVYRRQNNIELWRLSSCASGLVPSPPVAVVTSSPAVPCPVAGLNRCNDGNNLSSPTVAVDDTSANHLFISYAVNTGPSNEDVLVQDSIDGGANWGSCRSTCGVPLPGDSLTPCTPGGPACPVGGEVCCPNTAQVSSGILGRRFMPWVCSVGGEAYSTWFDRRNASPADNSLTDYFAGNAARDGFSLTVGDEIQYTSPSDSQCGPPNTNWAGSAPRNSNDSESCTQQPQLAGQCATGTCMMTCGSPMPGDSMNPCIPGGAACPGSEQCCVSRTGTRCDFSDCGTTACNMTATGVAGCQCPANQFCACAGGSPPKYGDYNGNACGAGRLYSTWASATSPPSVSPVSSSIDIFFSSTIVCCVPQIQVPGNLSFGAVCAGSTQTRTLDVCNTGKEDLAVDSITSSNAVFDVSDPTGGYPVVISPDACFPFQVEVTPGASGNASGTLTISSNDSVNPAEEVDVSASVGSPDVRVTGSTGFGDVCAGSQAEKIVNVCNVGACNLDVTSVALDPACMDFTLVSSPFPAAVSPDSCQDVTIRFTPTSAGPKSCTLQIDTDDPDMPVITRTVTASTPVPMIDVPPDVGFPPTVIQSVGACTTGLPFPVSNTGTCNLRITDFAISDNPGEFSLSGLPSFPIILEPGHIAGDGALDTVFAPDTVARERAGEVTVTYVSDPITNATTSITRALCGEGSRTGARVLVMAGGIPLPEVKSIKLQRLGANRNGNRLDTVDQAHNLPLQTVVPVAPCGGFQYHREYGTAGNPIQLAPGSYQVTVMARVNGRNLKKTVGFDVGTCDFNPTIVVDF